MAEKTKTISHVKHIPKDAQVIMSIMKDMGITDYEPKVINQLLEFTYRKFISTITHTHSIILILSQQFIFYIRKYFIFSMKLLLYIPASITILHLYRAFRYFLISLLRYICIVTLVSFQIFGSILLISYVF